jgi:preprotein translocase subunit SecE
VDGVQVAPSTSKASSWVHRVGHFLSAVRDEMHRVTWPSKPELIKATRMIVIFSIILGLAIGLMDLLLQVVLVDGISALAR